MKIKIDDDFLGPEWAGEYTVEVIYAPDSLKMYSEVAKEAKEKKIDLKDVETIQTLLNWKLIKYSVKKDGKPLPDKIPHKLYELLAPEVHRLNTVTLEEGQDLFLRPTTAKSRKRSGN